MRKLIFILAGVGIILVSCEKEKLDSQETDQLQIENPDNEFQNRASGATRTWYDYSDIGPPYGPTDYGCNSTPSDCLPTVVVYITGVSDIEDVFTAIESQVTGNIITAFQMNYSLLAQYVPTSYLDDVLDEDLTVRSKGDFSTEEAYMIFASNGIDAVIPFKKP